MSGSWGVNLIQAELGFSCGTGRGGHGLRVRGSGATHPIFIQGWRVLSEEHAARRGAAQGCSRLTNQLIRFFVETPAMLLTCHDA